MQIESFERLADFLRRFETWDERGGYDLRGIVHLLGACADNLAANASAADLNDAAHFLSEEQRALLAKIAASDHPKGN